MEEKIAGYVVISGVSIREFKERLETLTARYGERYAWFDIRSLYHVKFVISEDIHREQIERQLVEHGLGEHGL